MNNFVLFSLCFTLTIITITAKNIPELTNTEIANLPADGGKKYNRLIFEKSPYLLQHSTNPVNWYAWSKKTLELAEKNQKPIFLSVGYSSCHWCHVMNRESFQDYDIACLLYTSDAADEV